jgi:hypothetical protein
MGSAVSAEPDLKVGYPATLFELDVWGPGNEAAYDVTPDGQRFIAIRPEAREAAPLEIVVIPDFVEEMKARLAPRKSQP